MSGGADADKEVLKNFIATLNLFSVSSKANTVYNKITCINGIFGDSFLKTEYFTLQCTHSNMGGDNEIRIDPVN